MFNNLRNYFGDYAPQNIDHKKYEGSLLEAGGGSGTPLYFNCMRIIDRTFPGQSEVRVLDLACGRGDFGTACKQNKRYIIDGVDLFVPEKASLLAAGTYRNIIEKNMMEFNFPDNYDIVVSNQFLEHLDPKDLVKLLGKISTRFQFILVSVPIPYQTYAYTKDYLEASCKQSHELPEAVYNVAMAEVHKSYLTSKFMAKFGFNRLPPPVYYSNFFFKINKLQSLPIVKMEDFFYEAKEAEIEEFLQKMYFAYKAIQPRPKLRFQYEKKLAGALLMEPAHYKYIRSVVYGLTQPLRKIKRIL